MTPGQQDLSVAGDLDDLDLALDDDIRPVAGIALIEQRLVGL